MRLLLRLLSCLCLLLAAGCSPVSILNATVPSEDVMVERDVRYGDAPQQVMDLYRPAGAVAGLPVVVFLHGGNWRTGSKNDYPFVGRPLAHRGVLVVIPDYRKFPGTSLDGQLGDTAAATAFMLAHAAEYGGDPRRVFLMGHSSGAYDAAMVALNPRWLARAGSDRARLAGMIGLAGPYDFLPLTDPDVIAVLGPHAGPETQPITFADRNAPPLLLRTGDADTTVRPRNTFSLAARMRQVGGQVDAAAYPGLGHIGLITAFAPLFDGRAPVLDDVAAFVTSGAAAGRPRATPAAAAVP